MSPHLTLKRNPANKKWFQKNLLSSAKKISSGMLSRWFNFRSARFRSTKKLLCLQERPRLEWRFIFGSVMWLECQAGAIFDRMSQQWNSERFFLGSIINLSIEVMSADPFLPHILVAASASMNFQSYWKDALWPNPWWIAQWIKETVKQVLWEHF